jgi:LAS superfamily LD-carboxypeptidase LdcB
MPRELNPRQLTGLDDSHLVTLPDGHRLQAEVARAFADLREDAREAGFELAIASSHRSFARQLAIWNGKAGGDRPVYDDSDRPVPLAELPAAQRLHAILRFSALPGASRHHWGTDLDVYDASAVAPDYKVRLSVREVTEGGPFAAFHQWLDARMVAGESRGFYRPYNEDRGGVAPERWHLSHAPASAPCAGKLTAEVLLTCWDESEPLLLRDEIEADLAAILARYVTVPGNWCPPA